MFITNAQLYKLDQPDLLSRTASQSLIHMNFHNNIKATFIYNYI